MILTLVNLWTNSNTFNKNRKHKLLKFCMSVTPWSPCWNKEKKDWWNTLHPPLLLTCPIFLVVNLFLNQHMMTFSGCLRLHSYLYVGIHQIIIWNCFVWDLLQRIQQIGCLLSINNLFITRLHMMTSFSPLLYT